MSSTHTEHEDHAWTINIGDHPQRADSATYGRSRKMMIKAVQESQPWVYGPAPYQDHHGGAVWVQTKAGPRMYLLPAGIEWSAQFCADPAKVDVLREWALALVDAFPLTRPWYQRQLGMTAADLGILTTPITDAATIAAWTDSLWNASVPLPAAMHTGVLPKGAGYHHYPKPIVDIDVIRRDDFVLFVDDGQGGHVAVAPVAPRGSGVAQVQVLYATPGSTLGKVHAAANAAGKHLILDGTTPQARQAFAQQADTP